MCLIKSTAGQGNRKTNRAARVALTRYMKRTASLIRVFLIYLLKKTTEVRMGKGKVKEYYACRVKPEEYVEIDGVTEETVRIAYIKLQLNHKN